MKYRLALLFAALIGWFGLAPQKASALEVVVTNHPYYHHHHYHHHHYYGYGRGARYWVPGHWAHYHHRLVWIPAHWEWY